ncbi:MAG: hypothetical protein V4773_04015 [Verrucomicrobiota bacterium]
MNSNRHPRLEAELPDEEGHDPMKPAAVAEPTSSVWIYIEAAQPYELTSAVLFEQDAKWRPMRAPMRHGARPVRSADPNTLGAAP